jgi:crossover junction endodeoxyribonuclease RuvC
MFVLGIDPGLSRCGYGCVSRERAGFRARAAGVITTPPGDPVPRRLAMLRQELTKLLDDLEPDVVVVERIFFRSNARTAMFVGQASGVALLTAIEHGCSVVEITNAEVKLAVTGYGNASKEQVQGMVTRLLGLDAVPGPADVADALALAICHLGAAAWATATAAAALGGNRR